VLQGELASESVLAFVALQRHIQHAPTDYPKESDNN
jgi:hypothetical protein